MAITYIKAYNAWNKWMNRELNVQECDARDREERGVAKGKKGLIFVFEIMLICCASMRKISLKP